MSLPLGVPRRAFSYDDALEDTAPMTPPPADLCAGVLWKQPVIPERKYQELSKVRPRLAPGCPWVPRSSGAPLLASPFSQASPPSLHPSCPRSRTSGGAGDRARRCCLCLALGVWVGQASAERLLCVCKKNPSNRHKGGLGWM